MERLFVTLLNMSLTASWIVGAVVLFRFIFRRAPKWILCLMWGLVALRLVIPGFLQSPTSMLPTTQPVEVPIVYTQPAVQYSPSENFEFSPIPEQPGTERPQPILTPSASVADQMQEEEGREQLQLPQVQQAHDTPEKSLFYWCSIIWGIGVCLMIAYCMLSYIRLYLLVREHIPVRKNVYICDKASSPFILGIICPKIYLPVSLHEEDQKYVLAHEYTHIRRKDHWWKPVGFVLLSIYWFNPAMWLAYILLCRDIEGACDEKVIKELGEEQKKPYSNALINCSAPARLISACPLAFGEGKLRNRIKSVLHYKKPTLWILLVCLIASMVIAVVFLTDPMKKAKSEDVSLTEPRYAAVIEDFNKLVSYRLSPDFEESWNRGDSILYSDTMRKAMNTEASIRWPIMVITMVNGLDSPAYDSFGWLLYDMNKDQVPELFFVREDHSILAVFTIVNDEPMLIDAFWNRYKGVITENGELYTLSSGGANANTYTIKSLDKTGSLTVINSFYMNHGVLKNDYFDYNDEPIVENQFNKLLKRYPFEFQDSWYLLSITASKKVEYATAQPPESEKAGYEIVNNPGPDGQILDLDYPSLKSEDKDYTALNKRIEEVVYDRLFKYDEYDYQVILQEYTNLNYTVTCATDVLLSFYYEGIVTIAQTAHPIKIKQGFTFDLQTGQRLYLRDFTPVDDQLFDRFIAEWYVQIDDPVNSLLDDTDTYKFEILHCDQDGFETSFYIDNRFLCIVYPVPFAVGGHQTVRFGLDTLQAPKKTIYHYSASGHLTEQQDIYNVMVYFREGESPYSQVEVFLKAESGDQVLLYELGVWDFAVLGNGSLNVVDLDGDGIDEIIVHLMISVNGGTQTQIFKVIDQDLVLWHRLEEDSLPASAFVRNKATSLEPIMLGDYKIDFSDFDPEILEIPVATKIFDFRVEDVGNDGNFDIIYKKLIHWPYTNSFISEITLCYNERIGDLEIADIHFMEKSK